MGMQARCIEYERSVSNRDDNSSSWEKVESVFLKKMKNAARAITKERSDECSELPFRPFTLVEKSGPEHDP